MSQPTERERVFAKQMAVWDMNTLLHDAERRGAEQERIKGEMAVLQEQKKAEMAVLQEQKKAEDKQKLSVQKMYNRGIAPDDIAEIMNQDLETVKKWISEML